MIVGSPTKLNLIPSGVMPVVYINQGDAGYDKEFLIYNGDSPYNVPAGVSATIRGKKADGYGVTEAAALTEGSNLVTVTITEQMVAAAGENLYELVFVDANDLRIATINMVWAVKKDALGDSVISDSDLDYATTVMDALQSVHAFQIQLNQNTSGLAAEVAARTAADTTETAARIAADNALRDSISTEVAARTSQDSLLQTQINQIVAPTGTAPSAAEVENARIGANGVTYSSLGNAVRSQVADLKDDVSQVNNVEVYIADDYTSRTLIEYTGYDTNRALTTDGKSVTNGSVILAFPVTAGSIIKVSLKNRTDGDILYFFQDAQSVPWSGNTHIIGQIKYGDSFTGYLKVPNGASYLVTNADLSAIVSAVSTVNHVNSMKYRGALAAGAYTNALVGTYAVDNTVVTGLPDGMTRYGWLTCYVENSLYTLVESNTPKTTWLREGSSTWKQIFPQPQIESSRLGGKLIAYNGDSITESRMSGYSSNGGGFPYIISQLVGGTYENKAVSGGTLAVSSAEHNICTSISTMTNSADIVCLEGGINDYWLNVPLGTYSPSDFTGAIDNTTICGALESIFRQAIDKWVGKPIVFIIVHKITTTAWTQNSAGYTFADAREKMLGICEKYSIPVLDMWGSGGLNAYMASLDNAFLNGGGSTHPDGCHPDENGYKKYYVPRLIDLFESILPYNN